MSTEERIERVEQELRDLAGAVIVLSVKTNALLGALAEATGFSREQLDIKLSDRAVQSRIMTAALDLVDSALRIRVPRGPRDVSLSDQLQRVVAALRTTNQIVDAGGASEH